MDNLIIRSRAHSPELRRRAEEIEQAVWTPLGFLNHTRAHSAFYDKLLDEFAAYQLCLVDPETDDPVAISSCVPFACSSVDDLPAEGWDWIVESAASGNSAPNVLGALAVTVPHEHRAKGYARRMIGAVRDLAKQKGLDGVVVPVRPSAKAQHPFVSIDDYITWTDERGRLYDPWLRSHLAAGGRIVRPCERSMVVEQPIQFWEGWAGQRLDRSGDYAIDGALVPVSIDVERQVGRYAEPNVWVSYLN
jgi:hypothetical protein